MLKKAVLIHVDFKNNKISYDFFEGDNSYQDAFSLREAKEGDFDKNHKFRIVSNTTNLACMD